MPSLFVLSGSGRKSKTLGDDGGSDGERCKCVKNPRTKRVTKICFVGKSKKSRSGWKIVGVCR